MDIEKALCGREWEPSDFAVQKQNLAIQNDAWEKRKGILQNQKGNIYWDTPKGITLR